MPRFSKQQSNYLEHRFTTETGCSYYSNCLTCIYPKCIFDENLPQQIRKLQSKRDRLIKFSKQGSLDVDSLDNAVKQLEIHSKLKLILNKLIEFNSQGRFDKIRRLLIKFKYVDE